MIEFKQFIFGCKTHHCRLNFSRLPNNGLIAVVGVNGSGKTTFFESILGIRKHEGYVEVDKRNISKKEFEYFSYIPQNIISSIRLPAKEWILQGVAPYRSAFYIPNKDDEDKLSLLIEKYPIISEDLLSRHVSTLSGGELKKCAILRCLLQNTIFIIMDEIFAQLDLETCMELRNILTELKRDHLILVSIHDTFALHYMDSAIYINKNNDNTRVFNRTDHMEKAICEIYKDNIMNKNDYITTTDGYILY